MNQKAVYHTRERFFEVRGSTFTTVQFMACSPVEKASGVGAEKCSSVDVERELATTPITGDGDSEG